ncbi:AI-2E family transporter [Haloferax denitrificans]|uniref:AI-2E family transporter n=1 Tax=Haloferax denitrificans TaxID=35745 RepID=UPI003C6F1C30
MPDEPTSDSAASVPTDGSPLERLAATLRSLSLERARVALWLVAFALIVQLLYLGWRFVGTVVIGLFVYYVTRPMFRRINSRIESRTVAVAVTLVTVALPLLFVVGWAFAILVGSLNELLESDAFGDLEVFLQPYFDFTALVAEAGRFVDEVLADPSRLADLQLGPALGEVVGSALSWLGVAFNAGIHGFIALIFVFYLLRDDYRLARWARANFIEDGGVLDAYFTAVDSDLHNVYFGNILNALLTGVLAAVVYTLLNLFAPPGVGVPQAAFLGLLVGIASLVPVIGIKLVTWPVAAYLLGRALWLDPEALWFPVVFLLVSFVVVDYIPDQVLRPYVSGRTLHVGAVMLAYTVGPLLFGWYGIFLAPLLFVVTFEFGRMVFPWLLHPERPLVATPGLSEEPPEGGPETEATTESLLPDDPVGDSLTDAGDDQRLPGPAESSGTNSDQ